MYSSRCTSNDQRRRPRAPTLNVYEAFITSLTPGPRRDTTSRVSSAGVITHSSKYRCASYRLSSMSPSASASAFICGFNQARFSKRFIEVYRRFSKALSRFIKVYRRFDKAFIKEFVKVYRGLSKVALSGGRVIGFHGAHPRFDAVRTTFLDSDQTLVSSRRLHYARPTFRFRPGFRVLGF
eukprot:1177670-Prorocentrum_minimum.AAC.2